jgi:hypothetical protein
MPGIGSHTKPNRGATDDWITPLEIIQDLGPFDLDPCACETMPWKTAERMVTPDENGLSIDWKGRVWLNPPYGSATGRCLGRLADHGNGIALVFARTETAMFFRHVWPKAFGILFIEGRLHFHYPNGIRAKGNSGGPSCLIGYGPNFARLAYSKIPGRFVRLNG